VIKQEKQYGSVNNSSKNLISLASATSLIIYTYYFAKKNKYFVFPCQVKELAGLPVQFQVASVTLFVGSPE
jgi:hypothetical protein